MNSENKNNSQIKRLQELNMKTFLHMYLLLLNKQKFHITLA